MTEANTQIALFIPTLNGGKVFDSLLKSIEIQNTKPNYKIIIDSGSIDSTSDLAERHGFKIIKIEREQFNHGGTRNEGIKILKDYDFIVFLTQDVILANENSLANLLTPFDDASVACVYGRQLPHINANPLAIHARNYNYPDKSLVKEKSLIPQIGFKVSHISNAFCAYRTKSLIECGMFPTNVIIAEDTYLASNLIKNDYKIVYAADSIVYHSHNYSVIEEFQRYFDTGVFHAQNSWIRTEFGQPDGEGAKYVLKELTFILKNNPIWIFNAVLSNAMKLIGFKLGQNYQKLPKSLLRPFSMHKNYWSQQK